MWNQAFELLTNAEQERFRKVTNYLLNKTYVLREVYEQRDRVGKINADYRFLERNIELVRQYLNYAGYVVNKDDTNGIISISNQYDYNVIKLDKFTTLMLLTLRGMYDEERENDASRNVVFVRVSDVVIKMLEDKLIIKKPTIKETVESLRLLVRHNIIARLEGQIEDPTCVITIYPTIFKVVSNEKINAIYSLMFKDSDVVQREVYNFDEDKEVVE